MKYFLLVLMIFGTVTVSGQKISFSEKALNDVFLSAANEDVKFSEVLEKHKGKTILIDVWANWCKDCIVGMPDVKALQNEFGEVSFVFLSLDKNIEHWRYGIDKYKMTGDHYFISSGWEGGFCSSIDLDWIPRYIVVDANGAISLYRAIKARDSKIKSALSK